MDKDELAVYKYQLKSDWMDNYVEDEISFEDFLIQELFKLEQYLGHLEKTLPGDF